MSYWDNRNKEFVRSFQTLNGLVSDGLAGEETFTALQPRSWPLKNLPDGRECFITNGFNPETHKGIDVFWHHQAGDPLVMGYWTPYAGGKAWYPQGTRATAAADGTVVRADLISTGFLVLVQHLGGYKTGYFHGVKDQVYVNLGDTVKRGQDIFECGWMIGPNGTPTPTENNPVHLHFSAQLDGVYMDPAKWLRYATYLNAS